MKLLVFGCGKIGSVVAWDLANRPDVETVGIVDINREALKKTWNWIDCHKVITHELDIVNQPEKGSQLLQGYDVGVITLPSRLASYKAVEAAIAAGTDMVDILEEYHRRPDKHEIEGLEIHPSELDAYGEDLHNQAITRNITILDGMGLEPGLTNITVGAGIRKLDQADSVAVRVGGIPSREAAERHPMKYVITWAFRHVLREYMVKVQVIENGRVVEVDASTGRESFRFTKLGRDDELEAAITPGMPSFIYTRSGLHNFVAKTIRWPGHWQSVETLKECGLLDLDPMEITEEGAGKLQISPRDFVSRVLEPKLRPMDGDTDLSVMWNTVTGSVNGRKARIEYHMWDHADVDRGISSMARTTGFTAAAAAMLLAKKEIYLKGIVPPEDAIFGETYTSLMCDLRNRGIEILEGPIEYLN
jgi:saccharopine dehydrogenase-like NADP-dependent oxidoreductase